MQIRKIQYIFLLILAPFIHSEIAYAAIIDQYQERYWDGIYSCSDASAIKQTFTAGMDGNIESIDLYIGYIGWPGTPYLNISFPGGSWRSGTSSELTIGWNRLNASEIFPIKKGNTYSINISDGGAMPFGDSSGHVSTAMFGYGTNNPYPDGQVYWYSYGIFAPIGWYNHDFDLFPNLNLDVIDLAFRVNINPVPLPSAVWLLGCGLIGLTGVRKRFYR